FTANGITNEVGDVAHFSGPTSVFSYTTDSHSAKFKYSQAEADANYTISYYYESRNGCLSDPISETVHINPLPELSFSLNNNYNYNTGSIPLVGNHSSTDYLFSGEGVARDTLFTSAARIGVPIVITYSYTDANGCNNQLLDTTTIYQAPKTIDNLQSVYCYSNSAINISCTPNISDTITGTFVSKRNALEASGKNTAIYYIDRVGNGKDTVYFDYNYKGTDYSLAKEVLVDSIGNVFISGLDTSFCSSLTKVTIVGNQASSLVGSGDFSYSGSTQAFSEFGSSAELYPNKETQGTYSITYTFTSQNGCQSDTTMSFKVNAVPNVNFSVDRTCTDLETIPIVFTNLTTFGGTIEKWQWYLDGLGSVSSEEYNPSKIYTTGGAKQIRLTATTNQGCAASKDTILTIGTGTNAKFDWYNDCNSGIIPTQFVCTSDTDFIETYTWKVDNIDVNQDSKLMNYSFLKDTLYNVKLIVESIEHCRDSITKTVSISPVIKITDCTDNTYYQNFEDATDWLVKKEDETEYSSWNFGTPNGDIISNASSGDKAWFTNVNLNNQHVENSQIISPCFDFDTLSRPMLKFDMWSSPEEGRDGAVLQYSKDGGITWSSLGDVGQGINWFNSTSIKGQPADDYLGWSKSTNGWVSARHNLDSLKGSHLARFRIVYAADAQAIQEFNGFAFDNIWIGNKQQNVLAEYFTNTNLTDAEACYPEILSAEQNKVKDVIPIHYHTSTPSGDPFYNYYSSGPSARVAYYGIPKTPYSIVNGTNEFSFPSGLTTSSYFDAFEDSIDVKSLYDPKVSINIEASNSNGNCTINVNLTTNQDLTGKKLLLQCAVVKTSIDSDGKTYYNVLRKFIPDAGGTEIDSNLGENNTQTITLNWTPSSNDELANSMLIAFIQDVSTKEIYQTVKYDLSVLTGITPANLDSFTYIYPNPASKYVIVNCKYSIRQIEVYDITGRTINIYTPNQQQVSIPVETLKNGVYIIKGTTDKGTFIKKLIKVQ
ncbi:MAG TPA: T9SS type A sorting domain-containing protein, partial [Tenuifilaceae bacterium]|nr:T9SS type A sorting domain-containing protein [Tenuifilaceae bacterium]